MMGLLTEEEKQKIIEEEELRAEVRNKNRKNTSIDDYAEGQGQALLAAIVVVVGFAIYEIYFNK